MEMVIDLRDNSAASRGARGKGVVSGRPHSLSRWAEDSASSWGPTTVNPKGYVIMPSFKALKDTRRHGREGNVRDMEENEALIRRIDRDVNLCEHFLIGPKGNRSCFNKCN